MARQFKTLEAFIEWATANGWTVEREVWTRELVMYKVSSPSGDCGGNNEELTTWEDDAHPGEAQKEAWDAAWRNWEDSQREKK